MGEVLDEDAEFVVITDTSGVWCCEVAFNASNECTYTNCYLTKKDNNNSRCGNQINGARLNNRNSRHRNLVMNRRGGNRLNKWNAKTCYHAVQNLICFSDRSYFTNEYLESIEDNVQPRRCDTCQKQFTVKNNKRNRNNQYPHHTGEMAEVWRCSD